MALINKCSCCGYKFKRGDGAICPECFTSREDTVGCDDLSPDLHSHVQGFSSASEGMTEIEKQLEQERMQAAQEKAAMSSAASTSAMGGMATGNRSTSFGSSTSGNRSTTFGGSSSQNRSSTFGGTASNGKTTTFTTKNGRTTTTTYTSSDGSKTTTYSTSYSTGGVGPMSTYRGFNTTGSSPKTSKLAKGIIIFILISFVLSCILPIIIAFIGYNVAKNQSDNETGYSSLNSISISVPDISMPDIEMPEIPEIPDIPDYNDGFYYDDYAVLNQGAEIKTDKFVVKVGDPYVTDKKPAEYDEEYAYYTDYGIPEDCVTLEVPFTVTNNSSERLHIYEFFTYIISMVAEDDGSSVQFYSDSMATPTFADSVIEDGVTYTFALHYPIPEAEIYSIAVVLEDETGENYYYYIDYKDTDIK